ncbi:hypothetical protein DPMN_149069 [Dreissena polymorpha]|uniref:Serine protease n=1 Tax=Dreissena polymorpha TaxID=45954 RepID=A0A9D4J4E0_DREPO|nr:hypothetical protein DPMN_149069 [Dreissena polymorpha]
MASLEGMFTDREITNWLKAWLAMDIFKSGVEDFVEKEAKRLHTCIYQTVWSSLDAPVACIGCHTANLLKCPTPGICNRRGVHSICRSMHNTASKQPRPCPLHVCNKVLEEIVKSHKYSRPSWKNTNANLWARNPWEIAKAYLPPDGYIGTSSSQDTDLNGILCLMMYCTHFDSKFSFIISTGKNDPPCLLTKAREIGRNIRHSTHCQVTDSELQNIFIVLSSLLTDPTCLAQDVSAQKAVRKLAQLQTKTIAIRADEMVQLLESAQEFLKQLQNKALNSFGEISLYMENCVNDVKEHTHKRLLEDHGEQSQKCKKARGGEKHSPKSPESMFKSCAGISKSTHAFNPTPIFGHLKKPFFDAMTQEMMGIYYETMKSVGAILVGQTTIGTGFRVGSKYIMTAWHVVQQILDPMDTGTSDLDKLQNAYISFSDPAISNSVLKYKFKQIEFFDEKFDFAVLEILNPDQQLPEKLCLWEKELPQSLEHVSISGVGKCNRKVFEYRCPIVDQHDQNLRSEIDIFFQKHCNVVIDNLDEKHIKKMRKKKIDPKAVVDQGYKGFDDKFKLLTHCSMGQGASGSPMIACLDPAAGTVKTVAMLTHGIPEFSFCMNDLATNSMPNHLRFEAGLRTNFIFEKLSLEKLTLAEDLFS